MAAPKTRFYHASPRRFRHGDLLTGGHTGGYGYEHPNVCMTNSPAPHETIAHKAMEENWLVYEVEPCGPVSHNESNAEFQARTAKVIQCVGRTRGLATKPQPGARAVTAEFSPQDTRRNQTEYFASACPCVPTRGVKVDRPMKKYVWRGLEAQQNRDRNLRRRARNRGCEANWI